MDHTTEYDQMQVFSLEKLKQLPDMAVIVAGNYPGTFFTAALLNAAGLPVDAAALAQKKLENSPVHIFFLSVLCGVMMCLVIDNYNKSKNLVFVSLPVMIFILAGFEHSVADMFYFHLAVAYSPKVFFYLLLMILGNGVGAKVFDLKECTCRRSAAEKRGGVLWLIMSRTGFLLFLRAVCIFWRSYPSRSQNSRYSRKISFRFA